MKTKRVLFLISFLFCFGPSVSAADARNAIRERYISWVHAERIRAIEERIWALNLVNALNLSREQMAFLLDRCRQLKSAKERMTAAAAELAPEILPVHEELFREVRAGKRVLDSALVERFERMLQRSHSLTDRLRAEIDSTVAEVESMLKKYQLMAIDAYRSCFLPLYDDNVIGASRGSKHIGASLEKLRKVPDKEYAAHRSEILRKEKEYIRENLSPCFQMEDSCALATLGEAVDQARKMNDVDFGISAQELSEGLFENMIVERPLLSRQRKIYYLVLADFMIPIYEEWLAGVKAKQ